jgi:hypothetical protein
VKIADAVSGRPILSFYVFGGSTLRAEVPAGSFVLKYATGDDWCGDRELFGASTQITQTDRIFQFDDDHGYKIEKPFRRTHNEFAAAVMIGVKAMATMARVKNRDPDNPVGPEMTRI